MKHKSGGPQTEKNKNKNGNTNEQGNEPQPPEGTEHPQGHSHPKKEEGGNHTPIEPEAEEPKTGWRRFSVEAAVVRMKSWLPEKARAKQERDEEDGAVER